MIEKRFHFLHISPIYTQGRRCSVSGRELWMLTSALYHPPGRLGNMSLPRWDISKDCHLRIIPPEHASILSFPPGSVLMIRHFTRKEVYICSVRFLAPDNRQIYHEFSVLPSVIDGLPKMDAKAEDYKSFYRRIRSVCAGCNRKPDPDLNSITQA